MKPILSILLLPLCLNATAQAPLAATAFLTGGNAPTNFASLSNSLIYQSDGGASIGRELFICDGTTGGTKLLKEIAPSGNDSDPKYFVQLNGKLYFTATGNEGNELWVTDGTSGGTTILKDIMQGTLSSFPSPIIVYNGKLIFSATRTVLEGKELWTSDGTATGTVLLKDIEPLNNLGSYPAHYCILNGKLYFTAETKNEGNELWVTDGTAAGTKLVADINAGQGSSGIEGLYAINGKLYFGATDGTNGIELFTSDGTAAGTHMIKDINPGNANGCLLASFIEYNGKAYFGANDGITGKELWVTDGTPAGTQMLKDINPGSAGSFPINFGQLVYNGKLYFGATDALSGGELWVTDGTAAGTKMVKELIPGTSGITPVDFVIYKQELYFRCDHGNLYKTDGTVAGTMQLGYAQSSTNILPFTDVGSLTSFNNKLYFGATCSASAAQLWSLQDTTGTSGIGTAVSNGVSFDVFPNPNNGDFTIKMNEHLKSATVLVYNITGKLVYNKAIEANTINIHLDSDAKGMYSIQLQADNAISTKKIIIK